MSIKIEHEHLHHALAALTSGTGETGRAAREVGELLHTHFVKEEAFALPPLGVLRDLARGKATDEQRREALALSVKLQAELPRMLAEHEAIVQALARLEAAAKSSKHADALAFVEQLRLHAQLEEEVLYPAALLVGAHLASGHEQKSR